jgi:hypothetical protein
MKKYETMLCLKSLLWVLTLICCAPVAQTVAQTAPKTLEQGDDWNQTTRDEFYSQDQGSRLIPLKWIMALKQPNGEPFMAANLERYGYLPNPASKVGLPIGFTTNVSKSTAYLGMTCAACHTRQIDVAGTPYRIDGGPAIIDLQSFQADLDTAVNTVLTDDAAFNQFAADVLGGAADASAKKKLHDDLAAWFLPFDAITKGSLPVDAPWGPGRADAISLIFNRVTGLDIGPPPTYIIRENIKLADVPVRYPFLWNAWRQNLTQWPGFSPNGNKLYGLSRNTGEVFGVFAEFHPVKDKWKLLRINYIENNSANFHGLNKLEDLIMKLGPPKWPWPLDPALVAKGELVYHRKDAANGNLSCQDCHGIKTVKFRPKIWNTPLIDVCTDTREINLLGSQVNTGVMEGASIFGAPLKPRDSALSVLKLAVVGSILQHYLSLGIGGHKERESQLKNTWQPPLAAATNTAATNAEPCKPGGPYRYESRVMQGIWAAAPYLHNGSVPTLAELLTPEHQRVSEFMVGPAYDIENVGLAAHQTKFNYTLKTTDCAERNSGNSRCGHNYGTGFSPADKKALMEYLKSL